MIKIAQIVESLLSFCREAYADGLRGQNQEVWEHFGDESIKALHQIAGKEPSPDLVKFIRNFGNDCQELWEKGRRSKT